MLGVGVSACTRPWASPGSLSLGLRTQALRTGPEPGWVEEQAELPPSPLPPFPPLLEGKQASVN